MSELKPWLDRVINAQSQTEIFAILSEFRPLTWSDEERANIARTYNTKLNQINMSVNQIEQKAPETPPNQKWFGGAV